MKIRLARHPLTERHYEGHCLAFSQDYDDIEGRIVAGVLLVDCESALRDAPYGRGLFTSILPEQYARTGFMVDLEVWPARRHYMTPRVHKERWFPTLDRALDCLAIFCWAVEGCTEAELEALCAEHDGRWT